MSILEEPVEAHALQWRTDISRALLEQKERAKELFAARREKLGKLQAELSLRLAEVAEELAREQTTVLERGISLNSEQTALETLQADVQRRRDELTLQLSRWETSQAESRKGQQELLVQLQQQFADLQLRHAELTEAQQQLQIQRDELAQRETELKEASAVSKARLGELEQKSRHLAQTQTELTEEKARLALERQELRNREQATQRQRRSIARQLNSRKKELTAELELLRQEAGATPAQDIELQVRCSELQGTCDRLREEGAELAQQREDIRERLSAVQQQLAQKQGEWSQAQKQADEMQSRLLQWEAQRGEMVREREQWQAEKQRLSKELEQARAENRADLAATQQRLTGEQAATSAELQRLREENKHLEEWLTEAEARAEAAMAAAEATKSSAAAGSQAVPTQELTDLRRRLELATSECRDLKAKNTELDDQLAKARQASKEPAKSPGSAAATQGGMDWESLKQRMLANLEADFDESDPVQKADRLTIENAVQMTEKALAAKDQEVREIRREVEDLRSLLENQSSSIGQFAVGAAACAGLLDKDELVRQERINLQKMQESLHEQLKKAEIDISMERAKIARERAELDEKLHALEREQAQQVASHPNSGGDKGKKNPRGRWLSRLGLNDDK